MIKLERELNLSLYFLDFVSADGKRLLIEDTVSVCDVNEGPSQDSSWHRWSELHGGVLVISQGIPG